MTKKIMKILKSYASVFDGCIDPIDFDDIIIDIQILYGDKNVRHK